MKTSGWLLRQPGVPFMTFVTRRARRPALSRSSASSASRTFLDDPLGDRLGLPDQLPHAEVVVARAATVAVRQGGLAAQQQDDEVVGPQAPEPVDRGAPVGFGLRSAHDLGVPEERVLRFRVVGRAAGGPAVVRQRLVVAARPLQDVGPDQQQVGAGAARFQRAFDGGKRLVLAVLPQQRDGQVGVAERLVRRQVDELPVRALGLDFPLVLELRVADAVQPHLLLGRLGRRRGWGERGDEEKGGKRSRHGFR